MYTTSPVVEESSCDFIKGDPREDSGCHVWLGIHIATAGLLSADQLSLMEGFSCVCSVRLS